MLDASGIILDLIVSKHRQVVFVAPTAEMAKAAEARYNDYLADIVPPHDLADMHNHLRVGRRIVFVAGNAQGLGLEHAPVLIIEEPSLFKPQVLEELKKIPTKGGYVLEITRVE